MNNENHTVSVSLTFRDGTYVDVGCEWDTSKAVTTIESAALIGELVEKTIIDQLITESEEGAEA